MKIISIRKEQILFIFYAVIISIGMFLMLKNEAVETFSMPLSKKVIVIDAGHGGFDPGKVSGNVLEKDINLNIAKKLQAFLEQGGAYVIMTRIEDEALSSSKSEDMRNRKLISNTSKADIVISVHQNAYDSESVSGTQVFYFEDSTKSKSLADSIQKEIKTFLNQKNKLDAKSNENYFILKKITAPSVIVECGFLTNYGDKKRLTKDEYQEKMAWGIYKGVVQYFQTDTKK